MKRSLPGIFALALVVAASAADAADWPGWRGPTGLGYTKEKDLPLAWDAKSGKNVLWKAPLLAGRKKAPMASPGWSCPIVWRDRVFLTTAIWPEGVSNKESTQSIPDHHVLCYRVSDGEQLWDTLIPPGKCLVNNHYHGHAISTPVTDGKHVFVLFGSGALAAVDFKGKIVWREELPSRGTVDGGICSSLVLYGDLLILPGISNPVLRAVDKNNGKLRWQQEGKQQNRMATPAVLQINGRPQLIHMAGGMQGLDPDTGEVLWFCRAPSGQSSPVFDGGLIYTDAGRGGKEGAAIDPSGEGDVSKTHLKWRISLRAPAGSSGIIVGPYLYRACSNDMLRCWKMANGELVYEERLPKISPSTSPIAAADGRIYFASSARSYVIKAGPKFELLASNDLGERDPFATPAVSNGCFFIKGRNYLWCIGRK